MYTKSSTIALTVVLGATSVDAGYEPETSPSPDVSAKRQVLSDRLEALARLETQFTAPIQGERLAQWNNWNNLWNNINWLNWKNF